MTKIWDAIELVGSGRLGVRVLHLITVTPKQPGTYELKCRYPIKAGMVGKVMQ